MVTFFYVVVNCGALVLLVGASWPRSQMSRKGQLHSFII